MSQEKPKKHKWLLWAAIFSVFVFLVSPFMLYRLRNRAEFNRKVRELAAAGHPISFDDLEAAYVLPEGVENAADVYQKAFLLYVEPNEAEKELLPCRGNYEWLEDEPPFSQEVMNTIKNSLDKNREYLELLDEAARMEHCLFPRTRTEFGFDFEYLTPLKRAAQILTERNLYLAQIGEIDALFESTLACIGLTDALSIQPQLFDHLVIIAVKAMVVADLEDSLNLTNFSEEQLSVFQHRFRQMWKKNLYVSGLINERVERIDMASWSPRKIMDAYIASSIKHKGLFVAGWLTGLKDKDMVLLLDFYGRLIEIAQLPCHQQTAEIEKLEKEYNSYNEWTHFVLCILRPAITRIGQINLRVMSYLQCAETALAIERYRLKYNTLPESLEALVPEFIDTVFLDPFDGKPLRYILRDDGGYTVYCIGEDGIDNGGLDRGQMSKKTGTKRSKEFDHPFTVKH